MAGSRKALMGLFGYYLQLDSLLQESFYFFTKPLETLNGRYILLRADYTLRINTIADAAGIDLLIGDKDFVGKGYGTMMLTQFVDKILKHTCTGVTHIVADPQVENIASIRAFEKAGFTKSDIVPGEYGSEQLMVRSM